MANPAGSKTKYADRADEFIGRAPARGVGIGGSVASADGNVGREVRGDAHHREMIAAGSAQPLRQQNSAYLPP